MFLIPISLPKMGRLRLLLPLTRTLLETLLAYILRVSRLFMDSPSDAAKRAPDRKGVLNASMYDGKWQT